MQDFIVLLVVLCTILWLSFKTSVAIKLNYLEVFDGPLILQSGE